MNKYDGKTKAIIALIFLVIVLIMALVYFGVYRIANIQQSIGPEIKKQVQIALQQFSEDNTTKTITSTEAVSNYDLAVKNGFQGTEQDYLESLKGSNAISTATTQTELQTIVKQLNIPVIGAQQDLRVNTITGDLEAKLSSEEFWSILLPCQSIQLVCPDSEVVTPGIDEPNEIGSE